MTTSIATKTTDLKKKLPKARLFLLDEKFNSAGTIDVYLIASSGKELLCFDDNETFYRLNLLYIKKISPQNTDWVLSRYDYDMTKIIWKKVGESEEHIFEPIFYIGREILKLTPIIRALDVAPVLKVKARKYGRKAFDFTSSDLKLNCSLFKLNS